MKSVTQIIKCRTLDTNEVLFEDGTRAEMLLFLIAGSLRIEKAVNITNETYWPVKP